MNSLLTLIIIINIIIITNFNIFVIAYPTEWGPFNNLHETEVISTRLDHDCFYGMLKEEIKRDEKLFVIKQLVEYCIRSSIEEEIHLNTASISSTSTFNELKQKHITVQHLIQWSTPIDLIEHYSRFLLDNTFSTKDQFYNCTSPWFGPFCQYQLILTVPFPTYIQAMLDSDSDPTPYRNITCYNHMKCNYSIPLGCLDWRDICDGKVDCVNSGEDEKHCLDLELNHCRENEYQCRNGMCIDEEFMMDDIIDSFNMGCLDRTDTKYLSIDQKYCTNRANFHCEDSMLQDLSKLNSGYGQYSCYPIPGSKDYCPFNQQNPMFDLLFSRHNPHTQGYSLCFKILLCALNWFSFEISNTYCKTLCHNKQQCRTETLQQCSSAFIGPTFPVWDNHVRFGYFSNQTSNNPQFVCYDQDLCPFLISTLSVDNYTCIHVHQLNLTESFDLYKSFIPCHRSYQTKNYNCSQSTMLQCPKTTKCISKRRIMDGYVDCPDAFDESILANSCDLDDQKYRFRCTSEKKCIRHTMVGDEIKQCLGGEDEDSTGLKIKNMYHLPFSLLCDNFVHFKLSENDTDETHCDQWPCVNHYTRCNGVWNCPNGIDEVNCSSPFSCPPNHHPCLSWKTSKMNCLHIDYINDGTVDCLGATDERSLCRSLYPDQSYKRYRCWNDTECVNPAVSCLLCNELDKSIELCQTNNLNNDHVANYLNYMMDIHFYMYSESFFHLILDNYPPMQVSLLSSSSKYIQSTKIANSTLNLNDYRSNQYAQSCNQGIDILVGQNQTLYCLCPSTYYGRFCQYQNQRVSLTIQLRQQNLVQQHVISLIVRLVDHTGIIHSFQQITYIPIIDCDTKYNIHLLYHHRPKHMDKNYTIYIDAYEKVNLHYRTSWLLPIEFLFLPVNRMNAVLIIPLQQDCQIICSSQYLQSLKFQHHIHSCQCLSNQLLLMNEHKCNCSQDSLCFGFVNNRSICLCSINKIGPLCYINSTCQINPCLHNGICIPDDYRVSITKYACTCPDGYSGRHCEQRDVKIDILFSNIPIPQTFLIHVIRIIKRNLFSLDQFQPRLTMFHKIPYDQTLITIYISIEFHLIFAQINTNYYLLVLQHIYQSSINISTQISPSQYCPQIDELLNKTIVNYPKINRIKYYHLICRQYSHLMCFHDNDLFMCLCTKEKYANCFHFNFTMNYNCLGQNDCLNDGQCFQNHPHCPTKTMCVCPDCFYGDKCQLTTRHFGLSLDAILGYHIHSHLSITQQTMPVQISLILATLIFIIGIITGFLSNLTFHSEATRIIGCGFYLFISSITSMMIIIFSYIKLWFLILSQMNIIVGRSILWINCISIDFILRSLLATTDWIHSCVTIERFLIVYFGIQFDKTKSRKYSKFIIIFILILTTLSFLHDPLHRRIIHNVEEQRTWCLVDFQLKTEIYNRSINIFHFLTPFLLNIILVIAIIILTAKRHTAAKKQTTFEEQLKTLPRLIISFLPNCMKSPREYKIYLVGYFLSFVPPVLHFFIFVLTSDIYTKEFKIVIRRKWTQIKRCARPNPSL
ncbi:unnamed protein product [Adineta ricciae]|uniref:Uncharacterized protein n=1 Tax=Adineta ricciae TaxID=249248 RepID=A0A815QWH0_ADIRI|nr:unnamed protein product [Adineta ricciae]